MNRANGWLLLALPVICLLLLAWVGLARAQERKADDASPSDVIESELGDVIQDNLPTEGTGQDPVQDDEPSDAAGDPASEAAMRALLASLTAFVLAVIAGFEIITKVPPTLHTPLMSGSNAISGITIVGALMVAGDGTGLAPVLGLIAVILASINVVGGFLVTHRMLIMFKKR